MPKVETSLLPKGDNQICHKNCVSNSFGFSNGHTNSKQIQIRIKRNLDNENLLPKRRIVKKLVRVEPIYNKTIELIDSNKDITNNTKDKTDSSHPKSRRKLIIRKRKRPSLPTEAPKHTAPRRLVITRKRILTDKTTSSIKPTETIIALGRKSNTEEPIQMNTETLETNTYQSDIENVPDYEPYFPELTESLDSPILPLTTTVLSSVTYDTKTVTQTRLRTYTFIVTRVNGAEQIVTSTTEVKPQTKTLTITEPHTILTTLTLLDFEDTKTLPLLTTDSPSTENNQEFERRIFEEARHNLATRVMSNGVEVIVAGDKSTLPGEPDVKRILPSTMYKHVTLKPSTLSDYMMMMLPQDSKNVESLSSSLHPNQFVTKTCLTTFTYLTTFSENGSTFVSSQEQVISNVATEERNSIEVMPTNNAGITLTQHPNLAVGMFQTTYTYLNTILDDEQPLVITSKHTVTNTVTAPDDYLALLQPPKEASAIKDTNTYFTTLSLHKTLVEGTETKVISTNEVVTQVVITESIPSKLTSVTTSYIAFDVNDNNHNALNEYSTTDIVKTYLVTYTYLNTILENGHTSIETKISTSSDVVTEKLYLHPKRTQHTSVINTAPIQKQKKKNKVDTIPENLQIYAAKTYITTFTYFTTLLQEIGNSKSTVVSSHTREVENLVTEFIDPNLIEKKHLLSLKNEFRNGIESITKFVTLQDGHKMDITVIRKDKIKPTKVLPIEKTQMVDISITPPIIIESSTPNVVTGSTIIFFDELDQIDQSSTTSTPSLKVTKTTLKNNLGSILSSEIVKDPIPSINKHSKSQTKRQASKQTTRIPITTSKTAVNYASNTDTNKLKPTDLEKKKIGNKVGNPDEVPDLLGLGSINMNTFHALKPVINAMAGLLQTNLKNNKKNESTTTSKPLPIKVKEKTPSVAPAEDTQNRSPIYIPLGTNDNLEIAESQNLAVIHTWEGNHLKPYNDPKDIGKVTHESPLLNGGIPISPGQVITANSDVIVGKPGRIGPRIPAIPIASHYDATPSNMKPPPLSNNAVVSQSEKENYIEPIKSGSIKTEIGAVGSRDDYYGPPPPVTPVKVPVRPPNFVRGEKLKPIVHQQLMTPNINQDMLHIPINSPNAKISISDELQQQALIPLQVAVEVPTIIVTQPIHHFNIEPSILNHPIILPEVIERSTGQPLLINLQPSQVAFINIPHNRTTALLYGGSTEQHRNGQYFDDPSPYPQPEFSRIENYAKGIPQYASVYNGIQPLNQKQVGGVIKVGTEVININPPALPVPISSHINPSRAKHEPIPHAINFNVPPISFGMVHHGNDINAHIINHENVRNSHLPVNIDVIPINNLNVIQNEIPRLPQQNFKFPVPEINAVTRNSLDYIDDLKPPPAQSVVVGPPKHRVRTKPNLSNSIADYLTPPNFNTRQQFPNFDIHTPTTANLKPPNQGGFGNAIPTHININSDGQQTSTKQTITIPLTFNNNIVKTPANSQLLHNIHDESDDGVDDIINEAGEVIQGSNPRPLRPGQVPPEVLKPSNITSELLPVKPSPFINNTLRFPESHSVNFGIQVAEADAELPLHYQHLPSIQDPRPFGMGPFVRPVNQQTNQIISQTNVPLNNGGGNQQSASYNRPSQVHSHTTKKSQIHYKGFADNTTVFNRVPNSTPPNRYEIKHKDYSSSTPFPPQPFGVIKVKPHIPPRLKFVTSMPVNSPVTSRPSLTINEQAINVGLQTEQPFDPSLGNKISNKVNSTYSFSNDDVIPAPITIISSTEQNIIPNNVNEMQVMRPPPPPKPATDMKPPKIETNFPSGGIQRVPNINGHSSVLDSESQPSALLPYTPRPVKDRVSLRPIRDKDSPTASFHEEVLGMSPPPISTHKPILDHHQVNSSNNPVFSLEIDSSRPIYPYTFETPTTILSTTKRRIPGTRRPFTRRPTIKDLTTLWSQTPKYSDISRSTPATTSNQVINLTQHEILKTVQEEPSTVTKPAMEIIIGNPAFNTVSPIFNDKTNSHISDTTILKPNISKLSMNTSEHMPTTQSLDEILDIPSVENFTKGVHHAGNEIKVIDDSFDSSSIFTTSITLSPSTQTILIPTKYVTHTETSTVTITRTTVVQAPGGTPSTMTILVTKTEKSTKVDTVTEIHTILKPTSLIETITTTVNQIGASLYPPELPYGSVYSPYPNIHPTQTLEPSMVISSTSLIDELEDFIIHDTEPPTPSSRPNISIHVPSDNDSIFVVMSDKNHAGAVNIPEASEETAYETEHRDEVPITNEANHVLLGGIFIAPPPSLDSPQGDLNKCNPECKATKNELCQKLEGIMKCICRPGFARMFPDHPCKPTYTFDIKLRLQQLGKEYLHFEEDLLNNKSSKFAQLARFTHDALDRLVMQSDLRDIYHGVHVHSFEPVETNKGVLTNFYLQLSDNTDESHLNDVFKKFLRNNNYSLGGTELYASQDHLEHFMAKDFDECTNPKFHDCSENSQCFNLLGTYTCSCKEGYSDLSENTIYPGRICSAEMIGCEKCHYHGTCYSKNDDHLICECFQWYAGEHCQINLKVLLIGLATVGALLLILLFVCIIITCSGKKSHNRPDHGMSFMPQRLHNVRTLDRRAMINDTSSEESQSDITTMPYIPKKPKKIPKGALKKPSAVLPNTENGTTTLSTIADQKDRSLTVMIPRAKYHPPTSQSPILSNNPHVNRKISTASSNETKLLSYLDAGPSPNEVNQKRKHSHVASDSGKRETPITRNYSGGALISAGFEVSATVGGPMGTMGTIATACGTEADRSENATLIQRISADLQSSTGSRSQFTTFRKSLLNDIDDPLSNWLDIPPKLTGTMSESRSYDETTIQAPTKSYHHDYDSKCSSQHPNDEANTMAERDVGSTFLLPHTHLYKPDRGSDISGFDSL